MKDQAEIKSLRTDLDAKSKESNERLTQINRLKQEVAAAEKLSKDRLSEAQKANSGMEEALRELQQAREVSN